MRAHWIPAAAFAALSLAFGEQARAGGPALVFDPTDGRVLYAEDADDQWHPASLTKIMTAYLTFEAIKAGKLTLEQRIPYSAQAQIQPPMKLGLHVGATLTVDQALKSVIIKSANDVAVVLAEAVSGSQAEFSSLMNRTAQRLGMTRTTFVNASGLPAPLQVTTARDLAKLARAVVTEFPEHAPYWSMFNAKVGKILIGTHHGLLRSFEGADGLKTGFTCDSGYNVVASATRDGHRLMAVVLGESSGAKRTLRAATLLEHGFHSYGWKRLFNHTQSLDAMEIASTAKPVMSVRKTVMSYDCGNAPLRKKIRKKDGVSKKKKERSVDAHDAAAPGAPSDQNKVAAGASSASGVKPQ
jgi:D-alanyl-D-alanine carboxypeptidase